MAMVSLESCYERARQFVSEGKHDQAEGVCQHILQYYPQDLGSFQLLGQINLERKQGREARDYFRRVLEIDPENISAHWGMGIAYQNEGKTEQTLAEFEQALEIKPDLSDLRAQLLRLYGETYGPEQAQLRLSRAGLGRLYVKGGMLDKAITEFQEVLKLDPQRADVQVSLIEALWQTGDMENAARACEQVLQHMPDALKANLVLGYVHLSAGRREAAEELWRRAAACDPNNTMARLLFESAPEKVPAGMIAYGAATLPDFDAAAWEAAQAAAAARPPAPVEEPAPPAPAPTPEWAPETRPAAQPSGISWLDSLATGEGAVQEEEAELLPGVAPFDLEGIDLLGEVSEPSLAAPAREGEPAAFTLEEEAAAFTLEEEAAAFTLEEEAAAFTLEEEAAAESPRPPGDQQMSPFSLEDLGLSAEEIASLEEAISATKSDEAAPPPAAGMPAGVELPGVAPFSLEGELAPEEGLAGVAPFSLEGELAPEEGLAGVAPFSLEGELAPGEELIGVAPFSLEGELAPEEELAGVAPLSLEGELAPGEEAELPGLAPFSLEDVLAPGAEEGVLPGLTPFSLEDAGGPALPVEAEGLAPQEPFSLDELAPDGLAEEAGLPGFAPFSLEEADLGGEELGDIPGLEPFSVESLGFEDMPGGPVAPAGIGGELRPFSLEDLGLEEPTGELEPTGLDRFPDSFDDEAGADLPAFSWQEAGASQAPAFRGQLAPTEESPAAGPSLFERMKASRRDADIPPEQVAELPPAEAPVEDEVLAEEALAPFSLEEMGLEEAPAAAVEEALGEAGLPEVKPFSVEALGLEEEPSLEEAAAAAVAPFSLEGLGLEEPELPPAVGEAALEPFSLAELGLDEGPAPIPTEEAAAAPFSLEELGEEIPAAAEKAPAAAPAEDVLRPFSLEELGLTPDEITALGLEEEAAAPAGEPAALEEVALEAALPPVVEEVVAPVEEAPAAAVEEPVQVGAEEVPTAPQEAAPGLSLEEARAQAAANPGDETMLLALARAGVVQGAPDEAFNTYKQLVKSGPAGLDDTLIGDIQSWIEREEDHKRLYRLHRLLGDAYMKKGWYQQAINEYAWVLSKQ